MMLCCFSLFGRRLREEVRGLLHVSSTFYSFFFHLPLPCVFVWFGDDEVVLICGGCKFLFRMSLSWAFDVQVHVIKQRRESPQVQLLLRRFGDCRSRQNFSFQLLLSLEMWAFPVFLALFLQTHSRICIAYLELLWRSNMPFWSM